MRDRTEPPAAFDFQVAVVGAGPTGLLVAAELATAGVRVVVLERDETPDTTIKAGSINVATAEILDRRGLRRSAEAAQQRFFDEVRAFMGASGASASMVDGHTAPGGRPLFPSTGHFAGMFFRADLVDQTDPQISAHAGAAGSTMVRQSEMEALLAARVAELGVEVMRGVDVIAVETLRDAGDTETGILLSTDDRPLRVEWLIGADGGRSRVRHAAGIEFVGTDPEITGYQAIADLEGAEGLGRGWNHTPSGVYSVGPVPGRILTVQFTGGPDRSTRDQPVTREELQASIRLVTGRDVTVRAIHGAATRWSDNARQATTYRAGRILLAGDAAHVHSPFSGQGLNLGAGDAINLGWKLAATINGWAPEGLLDTYSAERHPVGAAVLDWTRAQVALMRGDAKTIQLRRIVQGDLLSNVGATTRMVLATSGVAQRYDLARETSVERAPSSGAPGHPLVGQLIGDAPLADGSRLADRFHAGTFVLLDRLGGELGATAESRADRVVIVVDDSERLDQPSAYRAVTGLFVRPDGVIAWATDTTDVTEACSGLAVALERWAGIPGA